MVPATTDLAMAPATMDLGTTDPDMALATMDLVTTDLAITNLANSDTCVMLAAVAVCCSFFMVVCAFFVDILN